MVAGRHSTMLSPERVRRVRPPSTTIPNTTPAQPNSHSATARSLPSGSSFRSGPAPLAEEEPSDWELPLPLPPVDWMVAAAAGDAGVALDALDVENGARRKE